MDDGPDEHGTTALELGEITVQEDNASNIMSNKTEFSSSDLDRKSEVDTRRVAC